VREVWPVLQRMNRLLSKDGQVLLTEDENLAELYRAAQQFAERGLPVLQAVGIIG